MLHLGITIRPFLVAAALAMACVACGDDNDENNVSMGSPIPDPTPTMPAGGGGHDHIDLASTEAGGGALTAKYDFDHKVSVAGFSACLGGVGDDCEGGIAVYTADSPAFRLIRPADQDDMHHPINDGTPISLELTAIDAAVSVRVGERFMRDVGDSDLIGVTPFHGHGEWQLALPGGHGDGGAADHDDDEENDEYHVSFKFTTTSPDYAESGEYTVRIKPGSGHGHDEDGDEDEDEGHGHGG